MIDPTALVAGEAKIAEDVTVGAFCVIEGNVEIERGTEIQSFCHIGVGNKEKLHIGSDSLIRSHSVLYGGSTFGRGFQTGHHVSIRESSTIGKNCSIGSLSDIQGHCSIGDHTRLHSNVHVGKSSKIGDFVWLFPYVVLTNDPHPPSEVVMGVTIEDFAVVATGSVILPGVNIGYGSLVGAGSIVRKDVKEGFIVVGNPAREVGPTSRIELRDGSGRSAYPWRYHFHKFYPREIVENWITESKGITHER